MLHYFCCTVIDIQYDCCFQAVEPVNMCIWSHLHITTGEQRLGAIQLLSGAIYGLATVSIALTLLVGRQEEHPACKNWVMRCWGGYLSGAKYKWLACGSADVTAQPHHLCFGKFHNGLSSQCQLTQVFVEKWAIRLVPRLVYSILLPYCDSEIPLLRKFHSEQNGIFFADVSL